MNKRKQELLDELKSLETGEKKTSGGWIQLGLVAVAALSYFIKKETGLSIGECVGFATAGVVAVVVVLILTFKWASKQLNRFDD